MIIAQSRCGVTATSANLAPIANDDAYSTGVGQALTMPAAGVLANDSDPEAGALSARKVSPTPPPAGGTSCPPYPTRCAVWGSPSDPANGSLTLNSDGSFTYTPNAGFAGTDSFTYVTSDPRGSTDTATVTVSVTAGTYLSIGDVWVTEGNAGTANAAFTITRSGATGGVSTVKYKTTNGTATAGSDYTALPLTTVTFAAGETTKAVSVVVSGDTAAEVNETFNVALSVPTGATISDTTGIGTIVNDDGRSLLSVGDVVVTEGSAGTTTVAFTITRSGNTSGSSTVSYKTTDVTATSGSDYTAIALTPVTFGPGETAKPVNVTVTGDVVDEVNETFTLNLSAPVQAVINDTAGTGTIVDDEGAVTPGPKTFFSVSDVSVTEGNTGTSSATFAVVRSGDTSGTSSVKYATANSTAVAPGDYTAKPLIVLSFAAGETSKPVSVTVIGDAVTEVDETFKLNLSVPVGGVMSDASSTATIVNDDFTTLSVNDVRVTEGSAGTTLATFALTRSGSTAGATTVSYKTTNGTATSGTDYTAILLTPVTFAAGETVEIVSVTVTGDAVLEPNETFTVNLSVPVGGVISDTAGTATILNDD